jgi:hypothetical protein
MTRLSRPLPVSSQACLLFYTSDFKGWIAFFHKICNNSVSLSTQITYSFHPDDGGDTFLRNAGSYKSHAASHPRRRNSSDTISLPIPLDNQKPLLGHSRPCGLIFPANWEYRYTVHVSKQVISCKI